MRILEALAELVAPTRCAGCELPGAVLCERCAIAAVSIEPSSACPRCSAPHGRLVCTECWNREYAFAAAICVGEFESELARVVALHKDGPERRLGAVLGALLGVRAGEAWPSWADIVTWVPASPDAIRRRGFDHARGIAEAVGATLRVPVADALARRDARDQRGLSRAQRAENVADAFCVREPAAGRVLLVDDVFTTGATLDAAACALLESGSAEVRAACIARTW